MAEFVPGSSHVAKVSMTNPTRRPWDYIGRIRMGTDLALMDETPFHLNGGETSEINFDVEMPSSEGQYPVSVDVSSGGEMIAQRNMEAVVLTRAWEFRGGLSGSCTRYWPDGLCHYADINWSIDSEAPNFRWELISWNWHLHGDFNIGGNGPNSGVINVSGGAALYAHPKPDAVMRYTWSGYNLVVISGGFVRVAKFAVAGLT